METQQGRTDPTDAPTVDDLFTEHVLADPYSLFAQLRRDAPVAQVPGSRVYLVSRWADVQEAVDRPDDFSSHLRQVLVCYPDGTVHEQPMDGGGTVEQVLATADDPEHRAHRTMLMTALSKRVRALTEYVGSRTDELWAGVEDLAQDGQPVDWVSAMADPLPISVVARLIGLPEHDHERLGQWALDSTEVLGGFLRRGRLAELEASITDLWSYLEERFTEAVAAPGEDLIGVLARKHSDEHLPVSTAVLILLQLLGAGGESTSALLSSFARTLAERPDLAARLRAEPDLVGAFTDEVLRLESPFRGHYRSVARECELGGVVLGPGDHLLLLWGSANRDDRHFPRPDVLDLDRPATRQHLAFGRGMHFCAGSALARMEASAVLTRLLTGTSKIELDGPDAARYVPSIFVRRHEELRLRLQLAEPEP